MESASIKQRLEIYYITTSNAATHITPCRSSNDTVNLEIFARILFSRITLKDTFVTLKIRD